jgi:hypothetical protein
MIVPKRFVSICARKSDIGVSSTDERLPYPALLITTSSEPKAPIAAFTASAAADSSVTSSAKSLTWPPWRSDQSCRDSMSLAVANILLPAARPASTIAPPRPRELPVTNQTCAIHPPLFAIGLSGYKNSLRSRSCVEIARAAPRATSAQLVIRYPALASSMHFGLALRPLKAACITGGRMLQVLINAASSTGRLLFA